MRRSYKKRMEAGTFNCCAPAYGYDLQDGNLIIHEAEAAIVRRVFTMFLSANILSDTSVQIEVVEGDRIIAITVPRAQRYDRPFFIEGNPLHGTYRRNGEGDYRCTREEVQAMIRNASVKTQDMTLLESMELDALDYDSIHRYRNRMKNRRPGHVQEALAGQGTVNAKIKGRKIAGTP